MYDIWSGLLDGWMDGVRVIAGKRIIKEKTPI
jgi:hypothetical protein